MFGVVGSSINLTWNFSNGVETVTWGLKDAVSATVDVNKKLISIGLQGQLSLTPPQAYVGRVSGSGNASSGSVNFILTKIKKSDEVFYGCELFPFGPNFVRFEGSYSFGKFVIVVVLFSNKNNKKYWPTLTSQSLREYLNSRKFSPLN